MGEGSVRGLHGLVERLEQLGALVDAGLAGPARWRGPLRRELCDGASAPTERAAVRRAFDRLATAAPHGGPLTVDDVLGLASDVGASNHFRETHVRVGSAARAREPMPASPLVPSFVGRALARAFDGTEPPALAATRLHLELLLIHPFRDGNGRVARLAASYLLMQAGFRSTLFTAVEQHFRTRPGAYAQAFFELRARDNRGHEPWLVVALEAMAASAALAAWWKQAGDSVDPPVLDTWRRRHPRNAAELDHQVDRLTAEEADALAAGAIGRSELADAGVER